MNNLQSLVDLLASQGDFLLILDLSLIQTIDYYTGIVFQVISDTESQSQILGRGGRYDQLIGLYHPQKENIPGIGFSLFIEDLHRVLLSSQQLPQTIPPSHWLVVPEVPEAYAAAFAYAEKLRNSTHLVRVEIQLETRDVEYIRKYAISHDIAQIAWVKSDDSPPVIESLK